MAEVRCIAAAVLSCAAPFPSVTICFLQLTVCHICVWGQVIFAAATVAMLGSGQVRSCTPVTAGLGGGWKYTGAGVMFRVSCGVAADAACRGTWRSAAAAATLASEAAGALGTVPVGVHVGRVLAAMVLRSGPVSLYEA